MNKKVQERIRKCKKSAEYLDCLGYELGCCDQMNPNKNLILSKTNDADGKKFIVGYIWNHDINTIEINKKIVLVRKSAHTDNSFKLETNSVASNGNNSVYEVIIKHRGKELVIPFYEIGSCVDEITLDCVMESIICDYRLCKSSPTLKAYISNRGVVDDVVDEYYQMKHDVRVFTEFFTEETMENLSCQY